MTLKQNGDAPIEGAATIVPVRDVASSIRFYVDVLGFEQRELADDGSYGLIACANVRIMLHSCKDDMALKATANSISIYIWVLGVDAFYANLEQKLLALPKGRVRPPFNQSYGMREFHVKDPDGCLLFFGEKIS